MTYLSIMTSMARPIYVASALIVLVAVTNAEAYSDNTVVKQFGNFEVKASSSYGGRINDELQVSVVISFLVKSAESMQVSDVSATCGGDSRQNRFAENFEKTVEKVTVPFVQRTFSRNYSSTYVDRHKVFEKEWTFRPKTPGTYSIPVTAQLGERQFEISGLSVTVKDNSSHSKQSSTGDTSRDRIQISKQAGDQKKINLFTDLIKSQKSSLLFTNDTGDVGIIVAPRIITKRTDQKDAQEYLYQIAVGSVSAPTFVIVEVGLDHGGNPHIYQKFDFSGPSERRFATLYESSLSKHNNLRNVEKSEDLTKLSKINAEWAMSNLDALFKGIGTHYQRFYAWEAIARSNKVENFSKWLDGEEIKNSLDKEIGGDDAGRSLFYWNNGQAFLQYVDRHETHRLTGKINLYEYPSSHVASWAPYVPIISEMIANGPKAIADYKTAENEKKNKRDASISSLFTTNASQPIPSMPSPSRSAKDPSDASKSVKLSKQDEALIAKIANEMAQARGGVTPGYDQSTGVVDIKESLRTMLANVKDEDYRNDGPSTITVVALAGGGSMDNIGMAGGLTVLEQLQSSGFSLVREIRRGETLQAIDTRDIPDGTTIYPIRLFVEMGMLGKQSADMYYFQDPFGSWVSMEVK